VSATEQLAALDAKVEEANQRYREALHAVERQDDFQAGVDALAGVTEYSRDVETKRREADVDELRRLTGIACERIVDEGLVLVVPAPGTIRLLDPSYEKEMQDALVAWNRAKADRDVFKMESHNERKAEADRAKMEAIRAALDGDDPVALDEALNGPGDAVAAFTTADLSGSESVA
jgi:hypothetical protein